VRGNGNEIPMGIVVVLGRASVNLFELGVRTPEVYISKDEL